MYFSSFIGSIGRVMAAVVIIVAVITIAAAS